MHTIEVLLRMLQAITPEQAKALQTFFWQVVDKSLWGLIIFGLVRLRKSIKSIPGNIADTVFIRVKGHFEPLFTEQKNLLVAHAAEDAVKFTEGSQKFTELRTLLDERLPAAHAHPPHQAPVRQHRQQLHGAHGD